LIETYCLPVIEGTQGAYTVDALMTLPFHRLLDLFEAICHKSAREWIANEPNEYTQQEKR